MKYIGALAIIAALLMVVTAVTVPAELGLDDDLIFTVCIVATVVALAGVWLILRPNRS